MTRRFLSEREGSGGERRAARVSEMPLRGFKNTRPALFAGPPTRADETARSRANREKNSLASSATRIHLSPFPSPSSSSFLPSSSHPFLVLPPLFSSKPCLCSRELVRGKKKEPAGEREKGAKNRANDRNERRSYRDTRYPGVKI